MPPKQQRIVVQRSGQTLEPQGVFKSTYNTLTSPDNAAVVRSVLTFGAAVAILSSSWADILLSLQ